MAGSLIQNLRFLAARPALFWRAAKNYGRLLAGRPVLRTLDLDLTYRCPCTCSHCYSDLFYQPDQKPLQVEEIRDLARQAIDLGALQISLSGGEPLVRTDLEEVIAACRPNQVLVSMCTSGVGLSSRRLSRLLDAGLAVLAFSLDDVSAATHDAIRGVPGLFDRVLERTREARARGVPVIFNTVATRAKLADGSLKRLAALAGKERVVLNLTMPTPLGRWQDRTDMLLNPEEIRAVEAILRDRRVRTDTHSTYGFLKNGPYCPAVREKIAVNAYGEVRACQILPAPYGNVREQPLAKLWEKMREDARFQRTYRFCPAADRAVLQRWSDASTEKNAAVNATRSAADGGDPVAHRYTERAVQSSDHGRR